MLNLMKVWVLQSTRLLVALVVALASWSVGLAAGDGSSELRLPPEATYQGAEGSPGPVVFSHATHVALAQQQCVGCHPALFSILQPTRGLTHEVMNAGGKCGACHDGTKASGVQDACEHCHRMGEQ